MPSLHEWLNFPTVPGPIAPEGRRQSATVKRPASEIHRSNESDPDPAEPVIFGHILASEVAPNESILYGGRSVNPQCNDRGIVLDRHVWDESGRVCSRCGAYR